MSEPTERDKVVEYLREAARRAEASEEDSNPWDAALTLRNLAVQISNGAHLLPTRPPLPTEPGEYLVTRRGRSGTWGAYRDAAGSWWHNGHTITGDVLTAEPDRQPCRCHIHLRREPCPECAALRSTAGY